MKVSQEFSKFAQTYTQKNSIQNQVVQKLLSHVSTQPKKILDLGCGHGAIVQNIDWKFDSFTGVDFAKGMLELHPKSDKINPIYGDFNDDSLFEYLAMYEFDFIFSASALQWAEDLEKVFRHIKEFNVPISLAIFSANTFKTLNQTAQLPPMLLDAQKIKKLQEKYFGVNFEVVNYTLEFNSKREIFQYIKQSGVSGSRKVLSYKEMKKLMKEYPLNYLEFEVVFIYT